MVYILGLEHPFYLNENKNLLIWMSNWIYCNQGKTLKGDICEIAKILNTTPPRFSQSSVCTLEHPGNFSRLHQKFQTPGLLLGAGPSSALCQLYWHAAWVHKPKHILYYATQRQRNTSHPLRHPLWEERYNLRGEIWFNVRCAGA